MSSLWQYNSTIRDSVSVAINNITILHFAIHRLAAVGLVTCCRCEMKLKASVKWSFKLRSQSAGRTPNTSDGIPEPLLATHRMLWRHNNPPIRVITFDGWTDRRTDGMDCRHANDNALLRPTRIWRYPFPSVFIAKFIFLYNTRDQFPLYVHQWTNNNGVMWRQ